MYQSHGSVNKGVNKMNNSERRKVVWSLVIFSVLVTAIAFLGPLLGGSPSSPGPGFLLWGTAPMLVSLLMRAVTRDWSDLGIKPAIGKNILWYAVSFLAFPASMVLTLLLGSLLSVSSISGFSLGKYLQTALTALPVFFIFAIFEEAGWRGYLAPKLAAIGINSYVAAALVAVVWATWHLPYFRELTWVYTSEDPMTFIPRFYLACFVFSILYGEIRRITGTFWPAVLMHAVGNSFGHPLSAEYVLFPRGNEYLGSVGNGFILIVLVGLLGIAIHQWRIKIANRK
jgi:membrane protease YdiL (CAAX protease family)